MADIMATYAILHNIRSAHNVGAIFRTADGAGVAKIFLTGYTPLPIDRFGRPQPRIIKTALGATDSVAWEAWPDIETLLAKLRAEGVTIVAVEQTERAQPYATYQLHGDTAYIFGNEIDGVPGTICANADAVVAIPMRGQKESLNVAVAAGVILFHDATHRYPHDSIS